MQRIRRLNPIRWLGVVIALALGTSIACVAQEVGFIDFTQIVARTELQHPAPRSDDASERRGGTAAIHECGPRATEAGALRTTLIWLDRSEYAVGDHEEFEVRIQNVGSVQIEFPFSPHLADLQPADASQKFGYSSAKVELWIGGTNWDANTGGTVTLYGADQHPGTILTMRPGEWIRIIGKGTITLPGEVMAFIRNGDVVSHANAQVSIYKAETLMTATALATVSHGVCPNQSQEPNVAMTIDEPR